MKRLVMASVTARLWVCAAVLAAAAPRPFVRGDARAAEPATKHAEFRGRIVCLMEERARDHQSPSPHNHEHEWVFKTTEGKLVKLARTKNSEALFVDARLREKALILKGQIHPATGALEAIVFQSMKAGVAHSLFYWCDICTIRSITPGECVCCREPVELREIPVKDDKL